MSILRVVPSKGLGIQLVSPFPQADLVLAWDWIQKHRKQCVDDYSPKTFPQFVIQERARQEKGLTYGVMRGAELGGIIWVDLHAPHLAEAHCVFKKEFWGHSTTLPALRKVADGCFSSGVTKILMPVFADNNAIRSVCRALGGEEEAYFKRHMVRDGEFVDLVVYSLFAPAQRNQFTEEKREVA